MPESNKPSKPTAGDSAPDFSLPDQEGKSHQLSAYTGKWVLLYFYPKDNTPGCTTQACEIRDSWDAFAQRKVVVFGVSRDSVASHKKFAEAKRLPFTLLSDADGAVCELYGVINKKSMFGKTFLGIERTSFLINPEGNIVKMYPKVNPSKHAELVLADLAAA